METAELLGHLKAVLEYQHQRFVYRPDAAAWGRLEHWEGYDQIPDSGPLVGDCDCFAMACRKALLARGIASRLVFCGVNNPNGDHLVLECQGWLLDNRSFHVKSWEDSDYTLISISGYQPGESWYKIAI